MSGWKQSSILNKNKADINACIMILETNKQEGEDFLYYHYKTNDGCKDLVNLKGVILASAGISNSLFSDDYRVMVLQEMNTKDVLKHKVCTKSYLKYYLVSVIMPKITPDNILIYTCQEFIEFLNCFFEKFEHTKKFTDILNKYSEVLLFNGLNYSISRDKEDLSSSPLSISPLLNLTFSYNEMNPCFMIKPPINDNLRTEVIEIMNTLNIDRSVLQDTLTLMDPPFYIRGFCLFYKGFVICNTLNNKELCNLSRLATLHDIYTRNQSSSELLSCEFLFENFDFETGLLSQNEDKRKILVTILAQRELVLLISIDIFGKNNCSFDPFYHKRAEDLLISLLKKGYNIIINNEIYQNSIKMIDDNNNQEEKIFNETDLENGNIGRRYSDASLRSKKTLKKKQIEEDNLNIKFFNSKIKGFIDIETKVNIIHFSCYDNTECVINTSDVNVTPTILQEIYRNIFIEYSRIQSNINKLKNKNKLIHLSELYQYDNISNNYTNVLKKEVVIKTKINRENFLRNIRVVKINEYGLKMMCDSNIPIWICCKIYEHTNIEDDVNLDEFSNYKIIFVTYESHSPVDIDSFCQDLLINDLFI